eukprot:868127-Prymnesium_polylepis.1
MGHEDGSTAPPGARCESRAAGGGRGRLGGWGAHELIEGNYGRASTPAVVPRQVSVSPSHTPGTALTTTPHHIRRRSTLCPSLCPHRPSLSPSRDSAPFRRPPAARPPPRSPAAAPPCPGSRYAPPPAARGG